MSTRHTQKSFCAASEDVRERPESVPLHGEGVLCFQQGFDATEQLSHAIALWNECGYTEDFSQRFPNDVAIHRINHDRCIGHPRVKKGSDLHTIGSGHGKIQNHQVGIEGSHLLECFVTVSRFANLELGTMLDKCSDRAPYRTVVIGNKNSLGHGDTDCACDSTER